MLAPDLFLILLAGSCFRSARPRSRSGFQFLEEDEVECRSGSLVLILHFRHGEVSAWLPTGDVGDDAVTVVVIDAIKDTLDG